MPNPFPESVTKIAKVLLEEIEKHYPGLTKKKFDNFGEPHPEGSHALVRAECCIYFELMKAGAFTDLLTENIEKK